MKTDEVYGKGNLNTALFWEYDTRVGRRWNVDPKPHLGNSEYSTMGGNPIMHSDLLGDTWTVGTDDHTVSDVISIPQKQKNSKYINIAQDGNVTLDFGDLSDKKIDKLLKKDDGLRLIKNLVDAKENYHYSADNNFDSPGVSEDVSKFMRSGGNADRYYGVKGAYASNGWPGVIPGVPVNGANIVFYKNASKNGYGTDSRGRQTPTLLPKPGYDGQVGFAAGSIVTTYTDPVTNVQTATDIRANTIRHELYENYLRTSGDMQYRSAHNAANLLFNGNYNNVTITGR